MTNYFDPWWRKYGILTLLSACEVAAVWVRSILAPESIDVYPFRFRSADGVAYLELLNADQAFFPTGPIFREIPYWSIMIPLIIFSLWLLLSKPRAGKTFKNVDQLL